MFRDALNLNEHLGDLWTQIKNLMWEASFLFKISPHQNTASTTALYKVVQICTLPLTWVVPISPYSSQQQTLTNVFTFYQSKNKGEKGDFIVVLLCFVIFILTPLCLNFFKHRKSLPQAYCRKFPHATQLCVHNKGFLYKK